MTIAFYLDQARKKNLYCRLSDGSAQIAFPLGYTVEADRWDRDWQETTPEDPHFLTLGSFRSYLDRRYHELCGLAVPVATVLATLKHEAQTWIATSGLDGIAQALFDDQNSSRQLPAYTAFLRAFEAYSGHSPADYTAHPKGSLVGFRTRDGFEFDLDTYAGLSGRLADWFEQRDLEAIGIQT
ncbi:hypothetical protein [Spirosoma sp. KNUC1025]|uniref:hypothetical protein n=1 Tax=Spirosoma sp. KNUC1025 TaxID=2894082 RepID=UPI001E3267A3|nr:hypothetical protein [Spirosoma sp. KNUC1025]UFH57736.1 hypothetical protein LN737_32440 [Spirosoma sp. KNUC1025]